MVSDSLLSQIIRALQRRAAKMNALMYGKIIIYVQDGRAVRLETSDSEKLDPREDIAK